MVFDFPSGVPWSPRPTLSPHPVAGMVRSGHLFVVTQWLATGTREQVF